MKTKLRIAIAENERDMREFIHEALERLGHEVVGDCVTGRDLMATAQKNGSRFDPGRYSHARYGRH